MQNMVDEIELTIIIYRVYGIQKVCITTKYLLTKIDLVIEKDILDIAYYDCTLIIRRY